MSESKAVGRAREKTRDRINGDASGPKHHWPDGIVITLILSRSLPFSWDYRKGKSTTAQVVSIWLLQARAVSERIRLDCLRTELRKEAWTSCANYVIPVISQQVRLARFH